MAFAFVASSVKAFPEGAESPFRNCFEQVLEFNVTAANTDQELNLATLAAADATNGPGILTVLSKVSRMNNCLVLQSARASEGAFATGNATITNYANLLGALETTTVTFPATAAAADGDFVQLTDAAGGKWALALDTDGGGVGNVGAIYVASTPIVVDISALVLAPAVATGVVAALTAPFLAVFTVLDNLNGTVTFTAKSLGTCADYQVKNAAEGAAGSITAAIGLQGRGADVITVGVTTFTAQAGAVTLGQGTFRAQTDLNVTAISLAAQINAHAVAGALVTATTAAAPSGVVTITAKERGAGGNDIALVYTDGSGAASVGATVSGALLTGGLPTAGYYISGTPGAPVFSFPGSGDTPTALHFVLRYRLNRDETPVIINNI
jgi:hypothetical protein